jgi:hypothetical protein
VAARKTLVHTHLLRIKNSRLGAHLVIVKEDPCDGEVNAVTLHTCRYDHPNQNCNHPSIHL